MFRSRTTHAFLVGCLAALASFCALQAHGGESYSIVAQSTQVSAATGKRPLAERIAAANLPIIAQASGNVAIARGTDAGPQENVKVAAVAIDEPADQPAAAPSTAPHTHKPRSPQSTARAFWKTMTGSRSGTVTR